MPRNNKRKKKLSNFKKFLCIYCGILLLAGVITLIMLHSLLKDYEEGKITIEKMAKLEGISINTMNKILCEYYIECGREKPKLNQRMDIKIEKRGSDE